MKKAGFAIHADLVALRKELKTAVQEFRDFNKDAVKAATGVKSLEDASHKSSLSIGKLASSIGIAQVATRALYRALNLIERGMRHIFLSPLKEAMQFETVMAKVSTVLEGVSSESIRDLGDQILEMTKRFPKTKEELGLGLYEILQAGIEDAGEAMRVLEFSTKAAVGGITEVSTAAKVATDIMGAYNMTAEEGEKAMRALFVGAQDGKAEFADLAGSMGRVMGAAAQLKVSVPEVVAGIEAMSVAGFSAEMAATSLNSFLNSVIKASKGTSEASKVAAQLGLEYNSTALKAMGLQKFIEEVTKKAGNNEVALQALTQDVRAFRAAAVIAGEGGEFFNRVLEKMETNTDALDQAFEKMNGTIENRLKVAWNVWIGALTKAGRDNYPELSGAVDDLTESLLANEDQIVSAAAELSTTLVKGMKAVVEYAPTLISALGKIAQAAATVVSAIESVIFAGQDIVNQKLVDSGAMTQEQFDLLRMERHGVMTPAERSLDQTIVNYNKKFGTNLAETSKQAALVKKIEEGFFNDPDLDFSKGDKGSAEKRAQKLLKAEQDLIKALGEQAKVNMDNVKLRRTELELREKMGVLTQKEEQELRRLNNRLEFKEDKIKKATDAWEEQVKMIERAEEKVKDLTERIADEQAKLQETIADIEKDAGRSAVETAADIFRKINEIRDQELLSGWDTGKAAEASMQMGDLMRQLSGFDQATLDEAQRVARMSPEELLRRQKDQRIQDATEKANARIKELQAELDAENAKLAAVRKAEEEKKNAVISALQERSDITEANYRMEEERARAHVNTMLAEFARLGGNAAGFATGGTVTGPIGHDNITARLTAGEEVINKTAAAIYRPLLKQMNALSYPMPGYAAGGTVSNNQNITVNQNNYGDAARMNVDPRAIRWHLRKL